MTVTDSVPKSLFSKASGHSYKHESFSISASEGVCAWVCFCQSFEAVLEVSLEMENIIASFFSKVFRTFLEILVNEAFDGVYY